MRNNKDKTITNQTSQKTNQYSIRKFTVGAASIAVGAAIFLGGGNAQAAEGEVVQPKVEQEAPTADAPKPNEVVHAVNPESKATVQSTEIHEAIKDPSIHNVTDNKERKPVDFKAKKPNSDEESFYYEASIKHPAQVIVGENEATVELTLDTPTTWKQFEVYKDNEKLTSKVTSYDTEKSLAKLQFKVPNETQKVKVKASIKGDIKIEPEAELHFSQPITNDASNYVSQDEFEKNKDTEKYRSAITLENKIYYLTKLMENEKYNTKEYQDQLAELKKALNAQVESAKKEYKNVEPTPMEINNAVKHNFIVQQSKDEDASHMDSEVVKPMQVFEKDGQKYVAMTLKQASIWDDFLVEQNGEYKRVQTIAKDKTKDERTIVFPYQEGINHYNAIVKVSLKEIGYEGSYHVKIKDLGAMDKADKQTPPKVMTASKSVNQPSTIKKELSAAPSSQTLNFEVKKDGEDKKSVMDGYMDHPAKVVKHNGKTYVQFTIKNKDWWQSFELFSNGQKLNTEVVTEDGDSRTINVEVQPGVTKLDANVHIVVPSLKYDNKYQTQIVFSEAVKELSEPKPKIEQKEDAQPNHNVIEKEKSDQPQLKKMNTNVTVSKESEPKTSGTVESHEDKEIKVAPIGKATEKASYTTSISTKQKTDVKAPKEHAKTPKNHAEKGQQLPKTGDTNETNSAFGILAAFLGSIALFWKRRVNKHEL